MPLEVDPARVMLGHILDAGDFRSARVLEVGAGDGRLTFQYAAAPRSVVAIDNNVSDILAASKSLQPNGNLHFLCASATALPFPAQHFSIVLFASVL